MAAGRRVTVTDVAGSLRSGDAGVSGARLTITNRGAGPVDLGGSGVVSGAGYELKANETVVDELSGAEELFAISQAAASNEVHILDTQE